MTRRRAPHRWLAILVGPALSTALLAQTPPRFSSIQARTNGEVVLRIAGEAGQRYGLDASTNLSHWDTLATLAGAAAIEHVDSAAPQLDTRAYRARQLADAATLTGDHLATTNGEVIIHPIVHASVLLKWNDRTIYVDPDDDGRAALYTGLPSADLILVTHTHGDHFDPITIGRVRKAETVIVAPAAVYAMMSAALKSVTTPLSNGSSTNLLDLTVEAVPAYNANHPKGAGNGYVVHLGGRRLYFSGDTEDVLEMRALRDIDVAFLCMNVPFTMTVTRAASAVREFQPRVVYPYHYRNQDRSLANLESFKSQVGDDLGIEVRTRKWY